MEVMKTTGNFGVRNLLHSASLKDSEVYTESCTETILYAIPIPGVLTIATDSVKSVAKM